MLSNEEKIILEIISQTPSTKAEFNNIRRQTANKLKIMHPSNRQLIQAYQNLIKKKRIKINKNLENLMKKADIRTLSGIAVITSLTKAYHCPGNCVYCPEEAKMPKSYLASEPAAARALGLQFDPYKQMSSRIKTLEKNGHPTDKIEYIIKGGTWNTYPLKYQYWFILESFRACNEMKKIKNKNFKTKTKNNINKYSLSDLQIELEKAQRKNEKAKHRIIGLTLETRPDAITPETIYHMRKQGCTRIELGLQAPDDKILKLIKRGHTVQQFKEALFLLRQAGFKVDLHFMPDLPGSTAKHDVEMYKLIFSDPELKPDMIKIYPCTVIKSAELYNWYISGKYKPYNEKKLFEALIEMKINTPRYCRISRLIRDIPNPDIEAGNAITNLREELKKEMHKRKLKCNCLRCREIGHNQNFKFKTSDLKLFIDKYNTIGGEEYFLSFEDKKRNVVLAFLRLRLPNRDKNYYASKIFKLQPEIKDSAFIRELHTYGQLISLNQKINKTKKRNEIQHTGLGKSLVTEAEKIVKKNNYPKIAVISGVGVRDYYRKLGYKKTKTYMIKKIR
ncbi:MAG: tRNA uridine(34) 5-carboxymethylaminomethyl modification radical SAM/GNAT enzyme Elp3 [Candidatus Magasanikbacteria bacterium]|nr:tRNA uridine(34) 5-carboxymethylaminomethyl modification radical SAM/GNAT enzyme Elp3 [Candidatus Magasanikbacteria bacterium]